MACNTYRGFEMNTNLKHTQGPWHHWNGEIHAKYPNQNGPFVAQLICLGDRETAANGLLIAAAPDLLAALKRMDAMYTKILEKTDVGASFYDAETIREMNEAPIQAAYAIAKAEGLDAWEAWRKENPPKV